MTEVGYSENINTANKNLLELNNNIGHLFLISIKILPTKVTESYLNRFVTIIVTTKSTPLSISTQCI